jgi:hypothetical protein
MGAELGSEPTVNCGASAYRVAEAGDSFDCRVTNAKLMVDGKTQGQVERITVKIDRQGNINWQQVRRLVAAAPTPNPAASPTATPAATPTPTEATPPARNRSRKGPD